MAIISIVLLSRPQQQCLCTSLGSYLSHIILASTMAFPLDHQPRCNWNDQLAPSDFLGLEMLQWRDSNVGFE